MSMDRQGTLFCDFCEKCRDEVALMVSSPSGHPLIVGEAVHICNECLAVCNMIMMDKKIPLFPFTLMGERPESAPDPEVVVSPTQKES